MANNDLKQLLELNFWTTLNVEKQNELIAQIELLLDGEYVHLQTDSYSNNDRMRVPIFKHLPTNLEFNLILGGGFKMGFSFSEEECAKRISPEICVETSSMRPVQLEYVPSFLMTRFPIFAQFAMERVSLDFDLFRPEFGENSNDKVPIYLTWEELSKLTEKVGFSLPTEAQWEYAYRGGTQSLFYFGDTLLKESTLENTVLLYNFNDDYANQNAANPFGLIGLQIGEWCKDLYSESYSVQSSQIDFSTSKDEKLQHVVRGGAAALWPWQDCDEWVLCMSAMRRSSETLEDGTCGARLVKELNI